MDAGTTHKGKIGRLRIRKTTREDIHRHEKNIAPQLVATVEQASTTRSGVLEDNSDYANEEKSYWSGGDATTILSLNSGMTKCLPDWTLPKADGLQLPAYNISKVSIPTQPSTKKSRKILCSGMSGAALNSAATPASLSQGKTSWHNAMRLMPDFPF